MNRAIFLDRDGVIIENSEHYYIWTNEQLSFVDGIFDNLKMLQQIGFQMFVVSNQGGISKGLYHKSDVLTLHKLISQAMIEHNIEITEMVFCPHHPDFERCLCRKPDSVMIEKLIAKYRIQKEGSFLIGDRDSDMLAAQHVGIEGILIPSNKNMFAYISKLLP
jgi:D-glycero-D-manno-heptose 1,7-bisphosphate phosphatase